VKSAMVREEMAKGTVSDCRSLNRWRACKGIMSEQGRSHRSRVTASKLIYKEFIRNEKPVCEKSEMPIVVFDGKDNITLP